MNTHVLPLLQPYFFMKETYQAFAETVIPYTPSSEDRKWEASGAAAERIDEFLIWEMNRLFAIKVSERMVNVPLALPTAAMLNMAAKYYIQDKNIQSRVNERIDRRLFAELPPFNRMDCFYQLMNDQFPHVMFAWPFQQYKELVTLASETLFRLVFIGYYSEWSGYQTGAHHMPLELKLHQIPISWLQTGYPGPADGYRDLRGYLIPPTRKEGDE
ncbi:hypothetical protein [Mechercharimyces sp. CAU 1602]|uniref:hypothetical protein n=1 Tax=Mechercharimyces sp. CAU 1602 TaxID=2973933 RepID=UPI00216214EA|nr:hypothetical protein [Mechercharimyces sp. CAU 1602]MCS1351808.1 hypothetical protein [Mechercharimyces sp. CAU 1602]